MGPFDLLDFENFLAGGDEFVVAVPAKSTRINIFISVLAVEGFIGSAMNIIAIATHSFCVVLLLCVWTVSNLIHLFSLKDAIQRRRTKLVNGLVDHLMGVCHSLFNVVINLHVLLKGSFLKILSTLLSIYLIL